MIIRKFTLFSCIAIFSLAISAQDKPKLNIHAGIRLQKYVGFYHVNGLSAEINSPGLLRGKLTLGANLLSSRLGSAFLNNGIGCHEFQFSAIRYFRNEKPFKPLVRLNTGIAWARYGSDIFKKVPNSSALLSIEPGLAYDFKKPLRLSMSFGYNFITGTGDKGYGMVWPLYVQFSGLYRFPVTRND